MACFPRPQQRKRATGRESGGLQAKVWGRGRVVAVRALDLEHVATDGQCSNSSCLCVCVCVCVCVCLCVCARYMRVLVCASVRGDK